MATPERISAGGQSRPAKRRADDSSNADSTSESKSESDYEEGQPNVPRCQKGANSIGRRLVKRRRAGEVELTPQSQVLTRASIPSSPSTPSPPSPPQIFSGFSGEVSVEGYKRSRSPTLSVNPLLKWTNMPYPGLPQIGYAFSYASGPIKFLKVSASASKFLAAHWHSPQNYAAYVIYSLNPFPEIDSKLQGLQMVNELAARGVIEDESCDVHEEVVQGTRVLGFQKGNVVVSLPKLGDTNAFRGYWPGSRVDEQDQKIVCSRLQSVMHGRVLQAQPQAVTSSPESARWSDGSRLRGTTLTWSEVEKDIPIVCGGDASLENCGLIKFVKVHWKQSKWIADNIHLIRSPLCSHSIRAPDSPNNTVVEDDNFKAIVVWSNKIERQKGINLLERMIAARLGGNKNSYMKNVLECREIMDDGEEWLVFHKKDTIVGFPGRHGDEEFLTSVKAMETVWR